MNLKSNKAITLVALIITIIILLILAGVSLSMILGENGLINKAQSSVNAYQQAAINEQNLLKSIEDYMGNFGLPENTPNTPAGTHVKPPAKWIGNMLDAVADGKGNTFPVPKSFYYVGGDYTNGVIISDDPADAYDGTTDKTTWEYTTSLLGNQFVWIPCTPAEYIKTSWGMEYGGYDAESGAGAEMMQVAKYGGFYVGRYEAGLADGIKEYTGNQTSNYTSSPAGYNSIGIPKLKAGELPWIFISPTNSKKSAEKMYENNNCVTSGLITGTQWDVLLNKIIGTTNSNGVTFVKEDIQKNSSKWGNYANSATTYTGRSATFSYLGNNFFSISQWGTKQVNATTETWTEYTTGASKKTEAYHTYDVAGNAWEWTDEIGQGTNYRVSRGGVCFNAANDRTACYRDGCRTISNVDCYISFRVVLYIK